MYHPAAAVVQRFSAQKDSVAFMVFFGTWCPDSHYVVPAFTRYWEKLALIKKGLHCLRWTELKGCGTFCH
ncbi:hypothetical protein LWM68_44745 [Niabella sp. W65]|nr:hypothetical protein [Niabella sp. W65]MCH7369217.1 hypothetical protein [Niabella sp. W65]